MFSLFKDGYMSKYGDKIKCGDFLSGYKNDNYDVWRKSTSQHFDL